jgi:hypothetical protein
MTNRRGFLGIFGAGAMIAPIIGGVPDTDQRALIVTPPTVEIPERPKIEAFSTMPDFGRECAVTVFIRNQNESVMRLDCSAIVTDYEIQRADITSSGRGFREYIPVRASVGFHVTGEVKIQV